MIKNKRTLFIFITLLLILLFAFLAAELIFRVAWDGKRPVPEKASRYPYCPNPNPDIGYLLKPNRRYEYGLIKTNELGFRIDNDIIKEKPEGTYRIAMLGDSIIFGTGTRHYKTIPHILQQRLTSHKVEKITRFETLNFAIPGHNLTQYIAILKDYVVAFKPDAIVLGLTIYNDFNGEFITYLGNGYLRDEIVDSVHGIDYESNPPSFLNKASYVLRYLSFQKRAREIEKKKKEGRSRPDKYRRFLPASCEENDEVWVRVRRQISEFTRICRNVNAKPLVLLFPTNEQILYEDLPRKPQELLSVILSQHTLPLIDFYQDFKSAFDTSGVMPFRDRKAHPDDIMYDLIGSRIGDWIVKHSLFETEHNFTGKIDIGDRGDVQYLSFGWGKREKINDRGYRWILGGGARIVFTVQEAKLSTLSIRCFPFEGCVPQRVKVFLDGHPVGVISIDQPGLRTYRLSFSQPSRCKGYTALDFKVSCAKLAPGDADSHIITRRLISVGVESVTLY